MVRSVKVVFAFAWSFAFAIVFSADARCDDVSLIRHVHVGFDGVYKVGYWTTVEVELTADARSIGHAASIEIVVPDGDGIPSQVSLPIDEAQIGDTRFRLFVKFGRVNGWMTLRIRDGDEIVAERRFEAADHGVLRPALPSVSRLVVSVGSPLVSETTRKRRGALGHVHLVTLTDARRLPDRWFAYTGIDALVMTTGWLDQTTLAKQFRKPQIEALQQWIEMGGQLVFSVGEKGVVALHGESPLARFSPAELEQVVALPVGAVFETYVGGAHRLEAAGQQGNRLTLEVAKVATPGGIVELERDGVPLIVRTRASLGSIVFVAVDLAAAPFPTWSGQPDLIAGILGPLAESIDSGLSTTPQTGYGDLSGQLRSALDQFEGVHIVARFAGLVFSLIAIYALIVGPIDYFLVRRFLKRKQLTWITFPALLVLACGIAYLLLGTLKGRDAKLNRVDLVDIDNSTGVTRGVNWTHAFSPASGEMRYDFRFFPAQDAPVGDNAHIVVSWMGMPGRALGGMNPAIVDTNPSAKPYEFSYNLDALTGVPIPAASSKSFIGRWRATSPRLVSAELEASERGGLIHGSALKWNANVSLPDAFLFHDRWVYRLGNLESGSQVRLEIDRRKAVLSKLRRQRIVDGKEVVTRFDPTNLDTEFIVQSMLFHAAAGGSEYTAGLENRYMGLSDMSQWLRPDTAILVGQPKDAILEVDFREADDDLAVPATSRHATFLRVVLPVEVID